MVKRLGLKVKSNSVVTDSVVMATPRTRRSLSRCSEAVSDGTDEAVPPVEKDLASRPNVLEEEATGDAPRAEEAAGEEVRM